ncbi:single hybrid motif-containing protein [Fomitopsis serialis]|uniref:single hybrid motif-containing protein n=1 Tax=Fomitopsis serialis TaxID=139415 RepID=UPI002007B784|nr:single hybrid motif-containing protein [Neoantrodia serialis]KAH9934976.1 single hybrid motif-containing protein [Neoantrodia serialis]
MQSLRMLSKTAAAAGSSRRWLQTSAARLAVSNFQMPAMSPTMTEGNIASWKKKDGEAFAAGDVLLEIETDKATIDVEAQDDGIMGKILAPDGTKNIPVGKTIALLAEEGDDISNLEPPKEDTPAPPKQEASSSAPTPPKSVPDKQDAQPSSPSPNHSTVHPKSPHPLFPSVLRLLQENGIENTDKIKGTGVRGMLTKGDVLTYLGRASGPMGTYKETPSDVVTKSGGDQTRPQKKEEPQLLDGAAVRQLIVRNMLEASIKARQPPAAPPADFDSIIADYLPHAKAAGTSPAASSLPKPTKSAAGYLDGLI